MESRDNRNVREQSEEEVGYEHEEEDLYELDENDGEEQGEDDYESDEHVNEEDFTSGSDDDDDDEDPKTGKESPNHGTTRQYENKTTKVLIQKGTLSLTVGEAKLYGLLNENGELKRKETPKINSKKVRIPSFFLFLICFMAQLHETNNKLSAVKDFTELVTENDQKIARECSFQPKKSQQALRAMKNPKCGYDFITKLKENGNFIERCYRLLSLTRRCSPVPH